MGYETQLLHAGENHVSPRRAEIGVAKRVVRVRGLHDAGQGRCLGQREIGRALAEVPVRSRFDTVGAGPEVGDVEIALEDVRFRVLLFEGECVANFTNLAGDALPPCCSEFVGRGRLIDQHVLDVLHGESGAALLHTPGIGVGGDRT